MLGGAKVLIAWLSLAGWLLLLQLLLLFCGVSLLVVCCGLFWFVGAVGGVGCGILFPFLCAVLVSLWSLLVASGGASGLVGGCV